MLQPLKPPCGPVPDSVQQVYISFVPRIGHTLQVWFYQCWVEVKDHLHWPAVNTPPNAAQTVKLPCHMDTLLGYGHLAVLSCKAVSYLVSHHDMKVHGIVHPQIWDLVLPFLFRCMWALYSHFSRLFASLWNQLSLMYQPLLPVFCHLQTCWECTLSHHSGY